MRALIKSGVEWMQPLLDFRDKLIAERNVSKYRNETRRNGQKAVDETGHNMGNYTMEYRIQLLQELLTIQRDTQQFRSSVDLITSQELIAIQIIWYRDGNFSTTVNDIYNEVYGYDVSNDRIGLQERLMLEKACNNPTHYTLIQELLALQKNKVLLMKKYGLQNDLEARLETFVKEKT
jgi:DNA sulfur modification protein DndC